MDFPLFFLDYVGNRMLMAVVAVVHVMINHPLAVGAYPLVVFLEWWARRTGNVDLDHLAHRVTFVLFIVTTSLGALTGVGIWFTAGLIAPFGIGSLLRVFFWAWFFEWLIFISEVVLVMIYFLLWKRWTIGGWKKLHIGVGALLALCSWMTMVIITAILGFMMGIGNWGQDHSLVSALFNPLYLPQLAFRTTFAMTTAGLFVWFLLFFFTRGQFELRRRATRIVSVWTLLWSPLWLAASYWYWTVVPGSMQANVDVAMMTQRFMQWHGTFAVLIGIAIAVIVLVALLGAIKPRFVPRIVLIVPFVLGLFLLGHFERVREFIRKPHVVADYMYSNGVTLEELPVLQRDGILHHATYTNYHTVTPDNRLEAGQDVFMIACSRCHTSTGLNGIVNKLENLYGPGPWDESALLAYVQTMHTSRTYMPPFPGNEQEAGALIAFLNDLQANRRAIRGAQGIGIPR